MTASLFFTQLLNGLQLGILLFLLSAGLTLVFGIMNFVNLAHGSIYMMGAYFAVQQLGEEERRSHGDPPGAPRRRPRGFPVNPGRLLERTLLAVIVRVILENHSLVRERRLARCVL